MRKRDFGYRRKKFKTLVHTAVAVFSTKFKIFYSMVI